jgi:hypothetical protein
VVTLLVDDLDGSPAAETVRFGLDGTDYEIDLSAANAARLRRALADYTSAARRVGPGPRRPADLSPEAVREWAARRGLRLSSLGALPHRVVELYLAADAAGRPEEADGTAPED